MTELAAEVTPQKVNALLLNRTPTILHPEDADHALFQEIVAGVTSEVIPVTGEDPAEPIRSLAVWCISLGTASNLEAALFPEQQLGEDARAQQLLNRYLGVLADLRRRMGAGSAPRGKFPPAQAWPDPARTW